MKRSVIQLAKNTLAITLPNKWARAWGVQKHDLIDIEEKGNELIVATGKNIKVPPRKVVVFGSFKHIRRQISIPYRQGCDSLEVSFDDPKMIKDIQKTLEIALGYEILSRGPKHVVIKDVANLNEHDFEQLFSRYFNVTISIAKDTLELLEQKRFGELGNLEQLLVTQAKLFLVCLRLVNKAGYKITDRPTFLYMFIDALERAGDHIERITEFLKTQKNVKLSDDTLDLYKQEVSLLEDLYKLFYKFDDKLGLQMMQRRNDIDDRGNQLIQKLKGPDVVVVHHLLYLNWTISEATSDVYGLKV